MHIYLLKLQPKQNKNTKFTYNTEISFRVCDSSVNNVVTSIIYECEFAWCAFRPFRTHSVGILFPFRWCFCWYYKICHTITTIQPSSFNHFYHTHNYLHTQIYPTARELKGQFQIRLHTTLLAVYISLDLSIHSTYQHREQLFLQNKITLSI